MQVEISKSADHRDITHQGLPPCYDSVSADRQQSDHSEPASADHPSVSPSGRLQSTLVRLTGSLVMGTPAAVMTRGLLTPSRETPAHR